MLNWLIDKFKKDTLPSIVKDRVPLTHQERLQAILVSYKTGKISIEQAVNLIYIWRLTKKK